MLSLDSPALKPEVKSQSNMCRQLLVKMRENFWPCIFVALSRRFVREPGMRQSQQRSAVIRREFNCHHGLSPVSCGSNPRHFHKPVHFKPEEPAIVRMSFSFELRFEIKGCIDLAFHQYGPGCRKPTIELFGPRPEQRAGLRNHRALNAQPKRPRRKIRKSDYRRHTWFLPFSY